MADKKKKKKLTASEKFTRNFLKFVVILLLIGLASVIIGAFIESDGQFELLLGFQSSWSGIIFLVLGGIWLLFILNNATSGKGKNKKTGARAEAVGDMEKFYDTNWLTVDQLKKDPKYMYHTYDELKNSHEIGIPIRAEYYKGNLNINMFKSIHTMVIGTTGSGKTTQFVDPMIQILGESAAKPCMVITDPKGELYDNHSVKLRNNGYRIMVFDLKEPFESTCWNPLTRVYDMNYRANNLEKEILVHRGDNPNQCPSLRKTSEKYGSEWYEFDGLAFSTIETLKMHLKSLRQQLKTEAIEELKDISATLCPVEATNDPTWERGAKEFIFGTLLAMLEDSEDSRLGMTRDKYNFYNLSKIVNLKDNDPYNQEKTLSEYFQGRDPLSMAVQSTNQVLANAPNTKKSYMGIVTERMALFSDMGVCYATNKNEMNLETFSDQPTALFIKIPDERVNRHGIATMFISQLYKILVATANKRGGALSREVHFIMDEFANMPAIVDFNTIITVARSRRIFFTLILQSYTQLTIKYKEDVASTVKDNCNIHIFIASNDQASLKAFSERCGNITVETKNVSVSKGKKEEQNSESINISRESRPLIYPEELASLKDEMIVSILKQPPLKAVFTPSYKPEARKFYNMQKAPEVYIEPKMLDEKEAFYDIKVRNAIVFKNDNDSW